MKSIFTFIVFTIIFLACKSNDTSKANQGLNHEAILKVKDKIVIDGHATETTWQTIEWKPLNQLWDGTQPSSDDFTGKYKLSWNEDYIYVLAEIQDDVLMDTHLDGLDRYWDDDCLELFIDENNSNGNHQFNHSATNLRVTDIGVDSLPLYLDHHLKSAKVSQGNITTWEVAVKAMGEDYGVRAKPRKLKSGESIGFAVAYCDNDSSKEREHFMGSIEIKGSDKNKGWIDAGVFNNWVLKE